MTRKTFTATSAAFKTMPKSEVPAKNHSLSNNDSQTNGAYEAKKDCRLENILPNKTTRAGNEIIHEEVNSYLGSLFQK